MRKSKRIRLLEDRVEELSAIVDILIVLVDDVVNKKTPTDLDSGKWYQQKP